MCGRGDGHVRSAHRPGAAPPGRRAAGAGQGRQAGPAGYGRADHRHPRQRRADHRLRDSAADRFSRHAVERRRAGPEDQSRSALEGDHQEPEDQRGVAGAHSAEERQVPGRGAGGAEGVRDQAAEEHDRSAATREPNRNAAEVQKGSAGGADRGAAEAAGGQARWHRYQRRRGQTRHERHRRTQQDDGRAVHAADQRVRRRRCDHARSDEGAICMARGGAEARPDADLDQRARRRADALEFGK